MLFSSVPFLYYFLPAVLLLYLIAPRWLKNTVLLLSSLVFYAWGEPRYVVIMLISILLGYIFGILIERFRGKSGAKILLFLSVSSSLAFLIYFKYVDFFIANWNAVTGLSVPLLEIALPIGISFYTFQILSYTVDVYRGDVRAQKNPINLAAYVALFPQLIAGPIVRYSDIDRQLTERTHSFDKTAQGIRRFIIGLGKKILIADAFAAFCSEFSASDEKSVLFFWLYGVAFSLQIYFDFSGYSDMAVGLARMFGIPYPENFNYPFLCKTIAEFWQRWHMTLGSFFRDYLLYVPIFGSQRKYLALFLVWFSTGIWHGAAWNYVIWGLFFGAFILLETLLGKKRMKKIPVPVKHIYTKLVLIIGFGIFRFEKTDELFAFLRGLVGANGAPFWEETVLHSLANNCFLLAAALLFSFPIIRLIREKAEGSPLGVIAYGGARLVFSVLILLIVSIMLVNSTANPFLYANF